VYVISELISVVVKPDFTALAFNVGAGVGVALFAHLLDKVAKKIGI
jgi:hypothetical protein